jgi:hypothetical protein
MGCTWMSYQRTWPSSGDLGSFDVSSGAGGVAGVGAGAEDGEHTGLRQGSGLKCNTKLIIFLLKLCCGMWRKPQLEMSSPRLPDSVGTT